MLDHVNKNEIILAGLINCFRRYQPGLMLAHIYRAQKDKCACGCGKPLSRQRKMWHSDDCRDFAYLSFAIIKGDTSIIREHLFLIDGGACRNCGVISDAWEADHILPVFLGGGACDISNFQTLCKECHKEKSQMLSHLAAISSQASSICAQPLTYEFGQHSKFLLKTSYDKQSEFLATSPVAAI
jgi:5-methylcytosine-specific restriction endonuclease McrA